jgi:hypothetical protein
MHSRLDFLLVPDNARVGHELLHVLIRKSRDFAYSSSFFGGLAFQLGDTGLAKSVYIFMDFEF